MIRNRLFLTSMLAVMVTCPVLADDSWPVGVGIVGVDTSTDEIDTSSSVKSGYVGGNMSGSTASCMATPLKYHDVSTNNGRYTFTAQWEADRCPVKLDLNLANGGAGIQIDAINNPGLYKSFIAVHDDGAFDSWNTSWSSSTIESHRMTPSTNGDNTPLVGKTVNVTWDTNATTGQTVSFAQGSSTSFSGTRPFTGFFELATGSDSIPYFSWDNDAGKLFITNAGVNAAKAVSKVVNSNDERECPETTWYAHWDCVNVSVPTVTSTGYDFAGWYTAATGGEPLGNQASYCWTEENSGTYYAHWTPKHYDVIYNSGSCKSGNDANQTVYTDSYNSSTGTGGATYNQYYSVPNAANTAFSTAKEGYTFVGWNTTAGQTTSNFPGASETPWTNISTDFTVYAACFANEYVIRYDCDGNGGGFRSDISQWTASGGVTGDIVTYDSPYGFARIPANTCAEQSNRQLGDNWSCVIENTSASVLTTWPSSSTNWTIANNVVCTAQWDNVIQLVWDYDYTVNDEPQIGYGSCVYNTQAGSDGAIVVPATPTRTGYEFKGWVVTDHQ